MNDTRQSLLVRLAKKPDLHDWEEFVRLYQPFLMAWFRRRSLQPADADDLTQHILTRVQKHLSSFEHRGPGSFRAWLGTIARRSFSDWLTQLPPAQLSSEYAAGLTENGNHFEQIWDLEHDHYIAHRLLERVKPDFDPRSFEVFQKLVLEGLKPSVVAGMYQMTVHAVYKTKDRILRRLREEAEAQILWE